VANALVHLASTKMTTGYGRAFNSMLSTGSQDKSQIDADIKASRAWPSDARTLIGRQSLDVYPELFLKQFAHLPLLEPADAEEIRRLAADVGTGMAELRKSEPISNAELWISLIERHWAELDRAAKSTY
jgi:hypothetical protein